MKQWGGENLQRRKRGGKKGKGNYGEPQDNSPQAINYDIAESSNYKGRIYDTEKEPNSKGGKKGSGKKNLSISGY